MSIPPTTPGSDPGYSLNDLTSQSTHHRPRWPWIVAAAVVLAAGFGGAGYALAQGNEPETAAVATPAPTPTPAAASPTSSPTNTDRDGCTRLSALDDSDLDPSRSMTVGRAALRSGHVSISDAGQELQLAAEGGDPGEIMRAQLELGDACGAIFGDGPW